MKNLLFSLLLVMALLAGGGCEKGSTTDPGAPPPNTPTLDAEPPYTPGTSNRISWSDESAGGATSYQVERARDAGFTTDVVATAWIPDSSYEFDDLEDATAYYYRVRSRGPGGASAYSSAMSSTQDTRPPTATLVATDPEQTSLLFFLEYEAEDLTSGVENVELWYKQRDKDGAEFVSWGSVTDNPIRFTAPAGGVYEFYLVATDLAGNHEAVPAAGEIATTVPDPIIITDQLGKEWDITNAVLRHGMAVHAWGHGLGQGAIRPFIDPRMVGPGHVNYPEPLEVFIVLGVENAGDARAYRLEDLYSHEVVDDTLGGAPLAVMF